MVNHLSRTLLLMAVLSTNRRQIIAQKAGGTNVCQETESESFKVVTAVRTKCGVFGWNFIPCTKRRTVQRYRMSKTAICCDGWVTSEKDSKDCDYAICFDRDGELKGTCANGGTCVEPGTCKCASGFHSVDCSEDVDECSDGTAGCERECENTHGSFQCRCPENWVLKPDSKSCVDTRDFCQRAGCEYVCDKKVSRCTCRPGFTLMLDQKSCQDMDECEVANGGCADRCDNTKGSYMCGCSDGRGLKSDHRTCLEYPYCEAGQTGLCLSPCIPSTETGNCVCSDGLAPYDYDLCYDPCASDPCPGNMRCSPDAEKGFSCECDDSESCDSNTLKIPRSVEVRKGGFTRVTLYHTTGVMSKTNVSMSTDADLIIQPNPVIFWPGRDWANISIFSRKVGKFQITFDQKYQKPVTMEAVSHDVFSRLRLWNRQLPRGCFNLTIMDRQFVSTLPWYRLKADDNIHFTYGISFTVARGSDFPISIDGIQLIQGTTISISKDIYELSPADGIIVNNLDDQCEKLELSPLDIWELKLHRSAFRSLSEGWRKHAAYWVNVEPVYSEDDNATKPWFETQFKTGAELAEDMICGGFAPVQDILYLTMRFSDSFYYDIVGQKLLFPPGSMDIPYCASYDFIQSTTFHIRFNPDNRELVQGVGFVTFFLDKSIEISLMGFGLTDSLKYSEVFGSDEPTVVYNGGSFFQYQVPSDIQMQASLRVQKRYGNNTADFEVYGEVACYVDFDPQFFFTHFYVETNSAHVILRRLVVKLRLRLMGKYFDVKLKDMFAHQGCVAALAGDDGDRQPCGRMSNPPGLFAKGFINAHFFQDWPVISNFLLSSTDGFYFFKTFDDKKDEPTLWTTPQLTSSQSVVLHRITVVKTYIANVIKSKGQDLSEETSLAAREVIGEMEATIEEVKALDFTNITAGYFADYTRNMTIRSRSISNKVQRLHDARHFNMDAAVNKEFTLLDKYMQLITGQINSLVWQLYEGSLPYFPNQYVLGVRGTMSFTVLGSAFTIKADWTMSDESVMMCSEYFPYYDHIVGGKPTRVRGEIALFNPLDRKGLWEFITPGLGLGVELAFSRTLPLFTLRVEASFDALGLTFVADLYITSKEIALIHTLIIYSLFEVRLSIEAPVPSKGEDIALSLKGEFLTTQGVSLEDSLWAVVRRTSLSEKDKAEKRLVAARNKKESDVRKREQAEGHLMDSEEQVKEAEHVFSATANKVNAAKKKVMQLKESVARSHRSFKESQQRLSVCSIKECTGILCLFRNVGCKVVRSSAYALYGIAQAAMATTSLALTTAETLLYSLEETLRIAGELVEDTKQLYGKNMSTLQFLHAMVTKSDETLEIIENKFIELKYTIGNLWRESIQKSLRVKDCWFKVELSGKNIFLFQVNCAMNTFDLGWSEMSFEFNVKDIFGSLFSAGKGVVDDLKKSGKAQRRKRSFSYPGVGDDVSNSTDTLYVERVTWSIRCRDFTPVHGYLQHAASRWNHLVNKTRNHTAEAEEKLRSLQDEIAKSDKFTLADLEIDFDAARQHFNLSRADIERTLLQYNFSNDPVFRAGLDLLRMRMKHSQGKVEYLRASSPGNDWNMEMESVPGPGDCFTFDDCVIWSFGQIQDLIDSTDFDFGPEALQSLAKLEDEMMTLLHTTDNSTNNILLETDVLTTLKLIFCGSSPVLMDPPENRTVNTGGPAELVCRAESQGIPIYYWYRGDHLVRSGNNLSRLTLMNVTTADEGDYWCVVGNHIANATSRAARLEVESPPKLSADFPDVLHAIVGEVTQLSFKISGKPPPHIQMICLQCPDSVNLYNFSGNRNLTLMESGQFLLRFNATNKHGSTLSSETLLTVHKVMAQCSVLWVYCGFNVRPVLPNKTDSQSVSIGPAKANVSLRQHAETVFARIVSVTHDSISVKVMTFDITNRSIILRMTTNCSYNQDMTKSEANFTSALTSLKLKEAAKSIKRASSFRQELFTVGKFIYTLNPAHWTTRLLTQPCVPGFRKREKNVCVEEFAEFRIPSPHNFALKNNPDSLVLKWDPPEDALEFIRGYDVLINRTSGPRILSYNVSSARTGMTLTRGVCGAQCQIGVRALSMSYSSDWVTETMHTQAGTHLKSLDRATVLSAVAGILCAIVALACGVWIWWKFFKRKKNVVGSSSDISTDSKEAKVGDKFMGDKKQAWSQAYTESLRYILSSSVEPPPPVCAASELSADQPSFATDRTDSSVHSNAFVYRLPGMVTEGYLPSCDVNEGGESDLGVAPRDPGWYLCPMSTSTPLPILPSDVDAMFRSSFAASYNSEEQSRKKP